MRFLHKLTLIYVALLAIFAFCIRLYKVDTQPQGVLVDEASIGFNAYSIAKTGSDEWGIKLPLMFRAFGDQKLPAYIYATVPFVSSLGMNTLSVRLPSVLAGVAFVIAIFFLVLELTDHRKTAVFASAVAAFSPWTIMMSRFGYESNLALLAFTLGLYSFVRAQKNKDHRNLFFAGAGLLFAFTWYSYIAYRMVTVIFVSTVSLFLFLQHRKIWKHLVLMFIVWGIAVLPLIPSLFSQAGTARFTQIGLLSDPGPPAVILEQRNFCTMTAPKFWCYALWNKPTVYGALVAERMVSLLSSNFLFLKGDEFLPYLNVDGYGQFFVFLLPLYLVGFAWLWQNRKSHALAVFLVVAGLLAAMLPVVLAGEPQKIRASAMLPFFILLIAGGFQTIIETLPKKFFPLIGLLFFALFTGWTMSFMTSLLTIHTQKYDFAFNTHAAKMIAYLKTLPPSVTVRIAPSFSDPIMQYAFLTSYDPASYQNNVVLSELERSGFQHARQLGNIEVTTEPYTERPCSLYVTDRDLGLKPQAIEYVVRSSNGVHPLLFAYGSESPLWCPELHSPQYK